MGAHNPAESWQKSISLQQSHTHTAFNREKITVGQNLRSLGSNRDLCVVGMSERKSEWGRARQTEREYKIVLYKRWLCGCVCVFMWKYMYICILVPMVMTQVLPLTTARSPQWPWVEQGVVSWIPIGCLSRHKAAVRPTFSLYRIIQSPVRTVRNAGLD